MMEYTVVMASGGEFCTRVGCLRTSWTAGEALRVLMEEWLDYIINNDIKYRMGDELNAEE